MSTNFFPRLILILGLLAPSPACAQPVADLGDFLAAHDDQEAAAVEYLRFIFLHPDDPAQSRVLVKLARCEIALGRWARAETRLTEALQSAAAPEKISIRFFMVECLLAQGRYADAAQDLRALANGPLGSAETNRVRFLQGVTDVFQARWEDAYRSLSRYFCDSDTYPPATIAAVLDLVSFGIQTERKDPLAARILSYVIPGAGQVYAGDAVQGFNSLLVTGLAGALVVWALALGDIPDAVTAAVFILQRFYFGGPWNAERIANEYNRGRDRAVTASIFQLLDR